jgi:hypothetical protein
MVSKNPSHTPGLMPGEKYQKQKEPGRKLLNKNNYRTSRDSTSINAQAAAPIDSRMPEMPPS